MADDSDKQAGGPAAPEQQRKRAKPARKDPARPTRAKANRPDFTPTAPELEALLNPGIRKGTAAHQRVTALLRRLMQSPEQLIAESALWAMSRIE